MTATCELVLPCRDEAAALPGLLTLVPAELDVIVVDNASSDGTGEVARRGGAHVVREEQLGYGAAVHAGVLAARAEWVAVMDGDGSLDPREVLPLLRCVQRGEATMAVGRRRPSAPGVWPWHARAGNAAVLGWLRRRTGLSLHDIAPVRVCRREMLLDLGVRDRRFGYPVELLVRADQADWRLREMDVAYRPRAAGTRSKVSGSVLGSLRAARDFARVLP
ncbi:MAG TPA: glycosyltransferase family 2 protein [Nocardioidaceae bacterium]|nr:glycosyltransferase family 2 protein [Nocardioidaceae bacterium]